MGWDIVRVLATCGALYGAHWLGWKPRSSVGAFVAAMAALYAVQLLLSYRAIKTRVRRARSAHMSVPASA